MKARLGFVSNSSSSSFTIMSPYEPSLYELAEAAVVEDLVEHGHSFDEAVNLARTSEDVEYVRNQK